MDPCPREQLAELVRNEGLDLIQDAGRIRALLQDLCPDAPREVAALVAAVEENVPIRIQRSSDSLSVQGGQERLARMLAQNRALTAAAASWAVQSWASILGKGKAPDDAAEAADATVSDPGMRAMPREKLRDLSQRYGPDLLQDPRRVKGLIQDLAPGYWREQAVLVAAMEEGIPQRIAAASSPVSLQGDLGRMAGTLSERRGLADAAALWGVQAWAWALGKGEAPADHAAAPQPPEGSPTPAPPSTEEVAAGGSSTASGRQEAHAPPPPPPRAPDRPTSEPTPPPPGPREKKSRRPVVLTAVGAILALVAALVVANRDETYTPTPTYDPPDVTSPPFSEPTESTGESNSALTDIQETFNPPSDSCEEMTSDVPDGAEYVLHCEVVGVDVRYTKWDSLNSMNTYFDTDSQLEDYDEETWNYSSTPDVSEGRFIEFKYEGGSRGLDWTYEDELVSGEAASGSMTREELNEWWRDNG
jgi:hypothetical protein